MRGTLILVRAKRGLNLIDDLLTGAPAMRRNQLSGIQQMFLSRTERPQHRILVFTIRHQSPFSCPEGRICAARGVAAFRIVTDAWQRSPEPPRGTDG